MRQLTDVVTDLVAEGEAPDKIMAGLDASQWALQTPVPGWTIKHQAARTASVFHIAGLAGSDPDLFVKVTAGAPAGDLLARWRAERDAVAALGAGAAARTVQRHGVRLNRAPR